MKRIEPETNDELRPEYDLRSLRVRKLGPGRKSFGDMIRLEPDVAEIFPDADSQRSATLSHQDYTREETKSPRYKAMSLFPTSRIS